MTPSATLPIRSDVLTCFSISLPQDVPTTCQHIQTSEEEGLFIACVAGVESGRDWKEGKRGRGLGRWGESVRVPFPFPCRAFLAHLLPLLFLCIPRRQACLFSCLSKDSVTLSKLCPSDTTKKQGYFVLTNFYLQKHLISKKHTFTLRKVSFPRFPQGCTTAKYRSNATTSSVNIEASAPVHANPPPVTTAHKIVPGIPFGWSTLWLKIILGVINVT